MGKIKQIILKIYKLVFLRANLYPLNVHLHKLALRGIGILNSQGMDESGENNIFKLIADNFNVKIIFDVGANAGGHSILMQKLMPEAKIFAFEPHPHTFKLLKINAKENGFKAYNIGFSEFEGNTDLWDFHENKGKKDMRLGSPLSSFYKEVITKGHGRKPISFKVKIRNIDEFCREKKIGFIDLLCVDTEGSEYSVLKGARKMIASNKIKIILFEFNEMNVYSRVFFKDFIDLLPQYKLFRLMPDGLIDLSDYDPKTHEIFAYQNIAAIYKRQVKDISFLN